MIQAARQPWFVRQAKRIRSAVLRRAYALIDRSPTLNRWYAVHVYGPRAGKQPFIHWDRLTRPAASSWAAAKRSTGRGPKVLMATAVGGHQVGPVVESVLAAALTLRGADVHVTLCDGVLPACFQCTVGWYPRTRRFVRRGPSRDVCKFCFERAARTFETLGIRVHPFSEFLREEDRALAEKCAESVPLAEIPTYRFLGLAVGEHALAGALRFYARASIDRQRDSEPVLRRYLEGAILTVLAMRRLLQTWPFQTAVFEHGLYVPHGLIGEVCRDMGVGVVNWGATYRQKCFILSHDETYHHTLMSEPAEVWEQIPWGPEMDARILEYLTSRTYGTRDWIRVHKDPVTDLAAINRELGIDPSMPCIGLLTNVMWDAQVCYPDNAFPNMQEWVLTTIRYFAERPDLQLLIRVHPSEARRGPTQARQRIVREIYETFPTLPSNIIIIPAESRISTYAVMGECNAVLIYATKAGVELAATGMPVIVAGEAFVRNKGITLDVHSEAEYLSVLNRLPFDEPLDAATAERARKYAYHFFFRRMIPLEVLDRSGPGCDFAVKAESLEEFVPGRNMGLDVICDGILHGRPFVFPAEILEYTNRQWSPPVDNDLLVPARAASAGTGR